MNNTRDWLFLIFSLSVIMKVALYQQSDCNMHLVTVTENGKIAYEELKDESRDFDLVLLDL